MRIKIIIVGCFLGSTGCWLFDLGLKVNSALLPNDIVQELKSNRKNDFIVEFILAIGVVGNLVINIFLGIKLRLITKKIKNLMKAIKAPN